MYRVTLLVCLYNDTSYERETIKPLAVRIVTSTSLLAERMKSYTLVFVALATVFLYIEYANAKEICHEENCITPDKCEELIKSDISCNEQGTLCCSVVKEKFRTHCHHHGGACMSSCPSILTRTSVDCSSDEVCCVLI